MNSNALEGRKEILADGYVIDLFSWVKLETQSVRVANVKKAVCLYPRSACPNAPTIFLLWEYWISSWVAKLKCLNTPNTCCPTLATPLLSNTSLLLSKPTVKFKSKSSERS